MGKPLDSEERSRETCFASLDDGFMFIDSDGSRGFSTLPIL